MPHSYIIWYIIYVYVLCARIAKKFRAKKFFIIKWAKNSEMKGIIKLKQVSLGLKVGYAKKFSSNVGIFLFDYTNGIQSMDASTLRRVCRKGYEYCMAERNGNFVWWILKQWAKKWTFSAASKKAKRKQMQRGEKSDKIIKWRHFKRIITTATITTPLKDEE